MSPPGLPGVCDVPVREKHNVHAGSLSVCLDSEALSMLLCPQMVTLQEQRSVQSPLVRKRRKEGIREKEPVRAPTIMLSDLRCDVCGIYTYCTKSGQPVAL